MTTTTEPHAAGCTGCDTTGDAHVCTGCGHWRYVCDYSHGYYCVDCRSAIQGWRETDAKAAKYR